jgi:hypothetical protein
VLEAITIRRLACGLIKDDIPERLIATRTAVATLVRMPPRAREFIGRNYLPVVYRIRVLGKMLDDGQSTFPRKYTFEIMVPERYVVVSEKGSFSGRLDGSDATVAQFLNPGLHTVDVSSNQGRLAVIWARAAEKGFSPFSEILRGNVDPGD